MNTELEDRLIRASLGLGELRDAAKTPESKLRLTGKKQGVDLALSYLREERRAEQ